MARGRAQQNGSTAVAEKPAKPRRPVQPKLIETAIEGQETLVKLAEKREEVASERGRLGEELQQLDEALLAEMKKLGLMNWVGEDGLTVSIAETEKIKVKRRGEKGDDEGGGEEAAGDGEVN